jgi:hypothetical protein
MNPRLSPSHYSCRSHARDLTSAVMSKVAADPTLVTNLGWRPRPGGATRAGTFRVDVSCPGDSAGEGRHTLRFRGRYEEVDNVSVGTDETIIGRSPLYAAPEQDPVPNGPAEVTPSASSTTGDGKPIEEANDRAEEVEDGDFWLGAREELRPEKSLARVGASVVGLALSALGLLTSASVTVRPAAKFLAGSAAVTAMLAVVLALSYLVVRPEKINVENLDDVEEWYRRQSQRARLVTAASGLLIVAVLMAGGASVVTLIAGTGASKPVLVLSVLGTGSERSLMASMQVSELAPGTQVSVMVLTGEDAVLLASRTTADSLGRAGVTASVPKVPPAKGYRLTAVIEGTTTEITVP